MANNINFISRSLIPFLQDTLPTIFHNLNVEDLSACSRVCKTFNAVISNETFCKTFYQRTFQKDYLKSDSVSFFTACKIRLNVLNGIFASHQITDESTIGALASTDKMFCMGLYNKTIKVRDLETGNLLQTLCGHHAIVTCVTFSNEKVYSGSNDKTIKIWNPKTGECLNTLIGHTSYVFCLGISEERLYSGSADNTVMVWDLKTETHLNTLEQGDIVHCLTFSPKKLYTGSDDGKIKVWDLECKKRKTFTGHSAAVNCLYFSEGKLFSSSEDKTIKIWDLENRKGLTLRGHRKAVTSLAFIDRILFSSSEDGTIKIWNTETGKCLNTLGGHENMVYCLSSSNGKLYSGSADKRLILWDFTAKHSEVLKEIARLFRAGDERFIAEAKIRFHRMPEMKKIYCVLGKKTFEKSTPEQKAQAIESYIEASLAKK